MSHLAWGEIYRSTRLPFLSLLLLGLGTLFEVKKVSCTEQELSVELAEKNRQKKSGTKQDENIYSIRDIFFV